MMVNKMVDGIKRGTIVLDKDKEESESEEEVFDLWEKNEDDEITKKFMPISAPKMAVKLNIFILYNFLKYIIIIIN